MRKIGYIRKRYPEIRNIINKSNENNTYVQIAKLHSYYLLTMRALEIMAGRILKRNVRMDCNRHAVYRPILSPKVDMIHTFNTVCDTDIPWVCTFETTAPRTNGTCGRAWEYGFVNPDKFTRYGYELLTKKSCIALIAISEANKHIQLQMMEALGIKNREQIADKIVVLPPPQDVLITENEIKEKYKTINDCIEFIFVGGLFFRKGGAQIVDALEKLVESGSKIHLTVVSSLALDDLSQATELDREKYLEKLKNANWITYFDKLPNNEVLKLCKKAHVGLLPTMADTYGYAVLEMQASGCPVLTTDVRALPEMNNDQCGYLIRVPKQKSTEAKYDTPQELQTLKNTIEDGVYAILHEIIDNPSRVIDKAYAAVRKIQAEHSPQEYSRALEAIYARADARCGEKK